MIAPRLLDPRAKSEYFIGLFPFSEHKDIVKSALKNRMHTITSAMFSRADLTLHTPSRDDSDIVIGANRLRGRRRSRLARSVHVEKSDIWGPSSAFRETESAPYPSKLSAYDELQSAPITPPKALYQSSSHNTTNALSAAVSSPFSVDTTFSEECEDQYSSLSHPYRGSSSDGIFPSSQGLLTPTANSHIEYANNTFNTSGTMVQILDKAHRRGSKVGGDDCGELHRSSSFDEAVIHYGVDVTSKKKSDSPEMKETIISNGKEDLAESSGKANIPIPRYGWLNKYSRRGIFKNWRLRYFSLVAGHLHYYEDKDPNSLGGVKLKVSPCTHSHSLKHTHSLILII